MNKQWWKEAVVYQIYPRSFKDTKGNGIGDLQGIIEKLDYLQELGITVVWLNPIYSSPNDDNGYDISDYQNIMAEFGTMDDFDQLLDGLHKRNIKLIMDLVVNHSSDEHQWFIESRTNKKSPYRDYYIWKNPLIDKNNNKQPPNNWQSIFGGPAWEYDKATDQYFLHLFSKKQPDLNWENPKLRQEIYAMMNWWFEKGVDGFRMDVINMISKYPGFPDYDNNKAWLENKTYMNGPRLHEFLQEMNRESLSRYPVMTVGECFGLPLEEGQKLVGASRNELSMVFQMEHVELGSGPYGKWDIVPWKLSDLKHIFNKWNNAMESCNGWSSIFLMNHDQPHSISKFGNDTTYRVESAKMLAMMKLTLKGTTYIYQGEEIGMTNIHIDDINDYRDLEILNHYKEAIARGESHDTLMRAYNIKGRDNARTPMQWDTTTHAGFTTGTPWLKVNENYNEINVNAALNDENSIFYFYKKLIDYRKKHDTLIYGEQKIIDEENEEVFAYTRTDHTKQYLIILNFTGSIQNFQIPTYLIHKKSEIIATNYDSNFAFTEHITLKPYQALLMQLM